MFGTGTTWGSVCTSNTAKIPAQTYPFVFTEVPMVVFGFEHINGNYWVATQSDTGTTTKSPSYQIVRGTSASVHVKFNFYIVGKWK